MFRHFAARRLLVAGSLVLATAGALPGPARAHAELTSADPAPNGSVVAAPDAVRLTFGEPIDPGSVAIGLLDTQQRPMDGVGVAHVEADGRTATAALPDLPPGVYTVTYQVVSTVDGHATAGRYAFLIDPTGAAPPPADSASATSPSVDGLTIAARLLALASLLVAFGSMVLWRGSGRATLLTEGVAAHPPWLLVGGASLAGAIGIAAYLVLAARPLAGAGSGLPLDIAGPFGWTPFAIAMRVAVLAALGATVCAAVRAPWWLASALLAVALAGMSMAGHVAAIGGPVFAALDWVHLLGVATWLGALPAAFVLASRAGGGRRRALVAILRGHGPAALVAAPIVALSGIANSPLVLGSGRDLVASDYGNLLVAKAGLLAVAVGIGAVNHLALRGRGRASVVALVTMELVVAVLAVSVAATMVTIQSAAARQAVVVAPPVHPAHFFGEIGDARVHVAVSLPAPGTQAYRVTVLDASSGAPPADVQKVFLTFTPPGGSGIGPERVELDPEGTDGLWVASGTHTPFTGPYGLEATVRRRGETDASLHFELEVVALDPAELGPPDSTGAAVPAPLAAAWSVLPPGPLAWAPAVAALAALAALWLLRPSAVRDAGRWVAVGLFVVATVAAGSRALVTAANAPAADDLAAQPPVARGDVERGRGIYLANCASCHGVDGGGGGPLDAVPEAPALGDAVASASDADLSYRIAYGVAGTSMPPFAGKLTARDRGDLIGYLRDRFGEP